MTKTTLYLNESELKALKTLAAQEPGKSVAQLIREGIQLILQTRPKKRKEKNAFLKKILKQAPLKSSGFGHDPVSFQRKLRDEWND